MIYMRGGKRTKGLIDWIKAIPEQERTTIVEVGSWIGESTLIFAEYFNSVICYDSWSIYLPPEKYQCTINDIFEQFKANVKDTANVTWYKKESTEAARGVPDGSVPVLYIDAQHIYQAIHADLIAWLPKFKAGGWIGGHDYGEQFPGVVKAVAELLPGYPVQTFEDGSWLVRNGA